MKKIWLVGAAAMLLFSSSGQAADKKGKFGLGFFNDDAPLGGRYWISNRWGLDLGFGINLRSAVDSTEDTNLLPLIRQLPTKTNLTDVRLDGGIVFNALHTEKVNLVIRPGFTFQRAPYFNSFFHDSIIKVPVVIDTTYMGDTLVITIDTAKVLGGPPVLDTVTKERLRSIDVNLSLGIEYFPTDDFSVSLFAGLGARSEQQVQFKRNPDGTLAKDQNGNNIKGDTFWTVTHRPFLKGVNIGFHFYF